MDGNEVTNMGKRHLLLLISFFALQYGIIIVNDSNQNSPEVYISITEPNLDTFKFNWDGTNYSFYDSSLVLAMNFNNNSAIGENATKAVDISKYGNNGTIYDAAWTKDGRFEGALQLDGVDDHLNAGNGTSLDMDINDFTVEAWVKSTNSTYGSGIVSKGSWENIGYFISYAYNPANALYFGIRDSEGYKNALFFKSSTYNWTHLVGIKTNNHLETWVNGFKINEYDGPIGSIRNPGLPLTIGKSSNDYYFNGSIDELRIWNRALSPDEIKMHYQSEFKKYNAAEWRFYYNILWSSCGRNKFGSDLNPTGDPVGGGEGYSRIISASSAKYIATNKSELLSSLSAAVEGDVIYVNDSVKIDLTYENDIMIPAGVTLASGRGRASSKGALLYTDDSDNPSGLFQLFVTDGMGIRITGIRLQGPDTEIGNSAYEFSNSRGIYSKHDIEVDNSELSGWSHCAVCLYNTPALATPHIHHNFIHHNRRSGLGYGVAVAYGANSMIEANIFDWNRHSIAGDGSTNTSYTARYNLVLGNGNGHSFDMHGGADRNDGTNQAGETINIYSNTFLKVYNENNSYPAILIRGIPTKGSWIHDNYLYDDSKEYAISQSNAFGNMNVYRNCYNGYLDYIENGSYAYYGLTGDISGNSKSSEIRKITITTAG